MAVSQNETKTHWKPERKKSHVVIFIASLCISILAILYIWRLPPFSGAVVYTNNAYVRGETTLISTRVGGYVTQVLVEDFDTVKQGDPLVQIDNEPYLAKVAQAQANLTAQQAQRDKVTQGKVSATASVDARKRTVDSAKLQLDLAKQNMQRIEKVKHSGAIAQREYDQAKSALDQAQMAYTGAQAQYTAAQQELLGVDTGNESVQAAIAGAKAMLDLAKQEFEHTVIYAPVAGRLGEVSVKKGQLVGVGTQLMFIVPPKRWVIANFKETDIKNMRIGQSARVNVDALGGKTFKGRVMDIAPATNAEFSVIKADGGNGNFIKIAQRIAVKVELLEDEDQLSLLAPGMSVEVRVDTQDKQSVE